MMTWRNPRIRSALATFGLCSALAGAGVVGAGASVLVGCAETGSGASRVKAGDLYSPGVDRYDDYFAAVHSQQATAAQWPQDRKTSHQPITEALKVDSDASDVEIAGAVHAKRPNHTVSQAVEKTVRSDTERAKELYNMASKIDDLVKTGHELEAHASEDFGKPGSGQSGPSPGDVKMELRASFEVLGQVRDRAKKEAKAAEDFLVALQQQPAKGGHDAAHGSGHATASKPSGGSTSASSSGSSSASGAPAATPAAKPAPQPAGEVFQP